MVVLVLGYTLVQSCTLVDSYAERKKILFIVLRMTVKRKESIDVLNLNLKNICRKARKSERNQ